MKRIIILFSAFCFVSMASMFANAQDIKITENKEKKQLDVTIDGQPCTSYVFWADQKKPFLSPLRPSKGTIVTRGYPPNKDAGERTDHPHHISMWFNYGSINGVDFWNNSGGPRSEQMGTIKHKAVNTTNNGKG